MDNSLISYTIQITLAALQRVTSSQVFIEIIVSINQNSFNISYKDFKYILNIRRMNLFGFMKQELRLSDHGLLCRTIVTQQ